MKQYSFVTIMVLSAVTALSRAESTPATSRRAIAESVRRGDALMQQSRDGLDPTKYAPARSSYEEALDLDSQNPAAMVGLAWVLNSEHRFADGAYWCEQALAIDESLPDAYALLSDGAVELGDYDRALDWCQHALDLRPDLASYSRASHLLWLTGDPARARGLMQTAIAAGGPHAENTAWCEAQLVMMLLQAGEPDQAGRRLEAAIARTPHNAHVLLAASRCAAVRGEVASAIALARQSVEAAPTHEALSDLVDLLELNGETDEARRQFARALAFQASQHVHTIPATAGADPAAPHFHGNAQLALFLADHGRLLDVALGEAETAWAATPNVGAADALAWCYHQLGRLAEAEAMMAKALKWHTPNPEFEFHAGMICAVSGRVADARTHLERALAMNIAIHPRAAAEARRVLRTLPAES